MLSSKGVAHFDRVKNKILTLIVSRNNAIGKIEEETETSYY